MALEKAFIKNTITGERFEVMFNPEQYTVNRDNNFAQVAIPGRRAPVLQFVHGNAQTLDMELLLDSVEEHVQGTQRPNAAGTDVRRVVRSITGLLDIDPTTHAPPILLFGWATFSFTCVLSKATQQYVMFRPDGTPVRAKVQVTFTEFTNAEMEAKEIKRETADYSRVHVVREGDSLPALAYRLLGTVAAWRPIALANGLDDPDALEPGTKLVIPRLPFRDPATGEVFEA